MQTNPESAAVIESANARFWPRIDKSGDCWLWTGSVNSHGYGHISIAGSHHFKCHRLAWTLTFGDIPAGAQVLHKCDVRRCCNPEHLFLGDNAINTKDCVNKGRRAQQKRTHCPRNHPYSPENTRMSRGKRYCRTCDRSRNLTKVTP